MSEENTGAVEDAYSDDSLFNITSWGADLTFRELVQMYQDGDLIKPEFQRNYVWSKAEASRFIESVLWGLPVPSIFLANASDGRRLIIDGYQRIMTMYDYMGKRKFGHEENLFRLTNSEQINERWRNKAFDELEKSDQRRLKQATIHAIIFEQRKPKDDDTSMFQIFGRINSSGRSLYAQEIRNCVCQGAFNALIMDLNKNEVWRNLYGATEEDSRMRDVELILRFFAIRDLDVYAVKKKQINLRKYLDLYMNSCPVETLERKREDFIATVNFVRENFGEHAFASATGDGLSMKKFRVNPVVFESVFVASDSFLRSGRELPVNANLNERKRMLLENEEYQRVSRFRTTNIENIEMRIKLAHQILFPEDC